MQWRCVARIFCCEGIVSQCLLSHTAVESGAAGHCNTNAHEFAFHDDSDPQVITSGSTIDTPLDHLSVVRMDKATWDSLPKSDQEAWDNISDKGNTAILTYASRRAVNAFDTVIKTVRPSITTNLALRMMTLLFRRPNFLPLPLPRNLLLLLHHLRIWQHPLVPRRHLNAFVVHGTQGAQPKPMVCYNKP